MDKTERYRFSKKEVKEQMDNYNCKTPEEALNEWAWNEFDLQHNGSLAIGKVGKTFIDVLELP